MGKIENLGKINYIPVLNGGLLNGALRDECMIGGKRATFYTNDAIFKYNKYLINPYHHEDTYIKIPEGLLCEDNIVLADSGGLQAINLGEVKHTPEEVYQWQQKNTNIGFSMDEIPFKNATGRFTGWVFDKANFLDYAKKSKENVEIVKKYKDFKKYPEFRFYGIIQGRKYSEYKQWYDIIKDDFIDGYCCKTPNNNPLNLAETVVFAINNIDKPIHFLGVGNTSKSIIIYYANKHLKQNITFDSSSYDIGTQYRSYLIPFMMNRKVRFVSEKFVDNEDTINQESILPLKDMSEFCDCVVCKAVGTELPNMVKNNDPRLGSLISLHNLHMNIKWFKYIENIIDNKEKLNEFVKFNFESSVAEKILDGFTLIDMAVDKGHKYALNHFKDKIKINADVSAQKSIFGF